MKRRLLVILLIILPVLAMAKNCGENYNGTGDWVVNSTIVCNDTIELNGSLIIEDGGNLTLDNATLLLNLSFNGQFNVTVEGGGKMSILNGSVINTTNSSVNFTFLVKPNANFTMNRSELHHCGYDFDNSGLMIMADGALIRDSLLSNNFFALNISSKNVEIYNSTFLENSVGISVFSSSNVSIEGNSITNCSVGISLNSSSIVLNSSNISCGEHALKLNSSSAVLRDSVVNASIDAELRSGSTVTAVNTSFGEVDEFVINDTSSLTVKQYFNLRVLTSFGNPLPDANVSIKDNRTSQTSNLVSNESGMIPQQELIYYFNDSTHRIFYNYSINVSHESFLDVNSSVVEMNESKFLELTLGNDTKPPQLAMIYPTSSNVAYRSAGAQLTVNLSYVEYSPKNCSIEIWSDRTGAINSTTCDVIPDPGRRYLTHTFYINTSSPDGWYNVTARMCDNSSNCTSIHENLSVVIDNVAPQLWINYPNSTSPLETINGSTIQVNFTYNETNPANYTIRIFNSTFNATIVSGSLGGVSEPTYKVVNVLIDLNTSDGWYNLSVQIFDNATHSNLTYENCSIVVDTSGPEYSGHHPANSTFVSNTTPAIRVNITDVGTGVNKNTVTMNISWRNGHSGSDNLSSDLLATTPISNGYMVEYIKSGLYSGDVVTVTVSSSDNCTNPRKSSTTWYFTIDTVPPLFSSESPANNSSTGDPTPKIEINITDATSGINTSSIVLKVNNGSWWDNVTCSNSTLICVQISRGYRIIYSNTSAVFGNMSIINVTVDAADLAFNQNSTSWSFTINTDIPYAANESPADGSYSNISAPTIKVDIMDEGNNLIPPTPPNVSMVINTSSGNSATCINNSCNPSCTTNGWCTVSFTPSFTLLDGEVVTVTLYATDTTGKSMNPPYRWSFTSDTSAPSVTSKTPVNYSNETRPLIKVDVIDTVSGVNETLIRMDVNGTKVNSTNTTIENGFNVSYIPPLPFNEGATVAVNLTAADNAGNYLFYSWSFTVDLTPPHLTPNPTTYPGGRNATNTSSYALVSVTCSDGISGVMFVEVNTSQVSTSNKVQLQPSGSYWTGQIVPNNVGSTVATYTLPVLACDNAWNCNSSNVTIFVDSVNPSFSSLQVDSTSISCGGSYTAPEGVTSVTVRGEVNGTGTDPKLWVNDQPVSLSPLSNNIGSFQRSVDVSNGTNTITLKAMDGAGNIVTCSISVAVPTTTTTPTPAPTPAQATPTPTPTPCAENWTCDEWGPCINGTQYRNCTDLNNCGTTNYKPVTQRSCTVTEGGVTATPSPTPTQTPTPTPSPAEEKVMTNLKGGSEATVSFSKTALYKIVIKPAKNLSLFRVRVNEQGENPENETPPGKPYRYYIITSNLKEGDADFLDLYFRVTTSWIKHNNFSADDVRMFRYGNGWEGLPTTVESNDTTYTYFKSRTHNLSSFAVVASRGIQIPLLPIILGAAAAGSILAVILIVRTPAFRLFAARLRIRMRTRFGRIYP